MRVFLILAAIVLLIRLPFFFPDVIDPDESTYILMGQDIVDGNLPYQALWAFMPPLSLYCFAAFITVLGKTIPAIRIGGALFMLLAAYFVYLSGERIRGPRTGFIAAVFLILYSTVSSSGGGTTSETLAIVPLTGALLLFLKDKFKTVDFFMAGVLISCACLIRLNLVYLAILGGLFILVPKLIQTQTGVVGRLAAYVSGGTLPVLLFFTPYLITSRTQLFISTLFEAPLKYSSSQLNLMEVLYSYLVRFLDINFLLHYVLLAAGFVCGLAYLAFSWGGFSNKTRLHSSTLLFFLIATGFSILQTGQSYEHYLVQVFPFIALIAALFLDYLLDTRIKYLIAIAGIALLIFPSSTVLDAYKPVMSRAVVGERLTYGPAYELSEYLRKANPENAPVYFMEGHIVHWFQNTKPLSKITTHPSNIGREYLVKALYGPSATVESELSEILAKEPAFIVKPVTVRYFKPHPGALALLSETLFMDYELVQVIGDFMVYKHF